MKIYWSAFFSLLLLLALASCGAEQFGTTPQSTSTSADALTVYQQASCANHTLVKPQVDILYVVDNSTSSYYVANDVKVAIQDTVNSISNQFDYRVIGTPLIATAGGNNDYQVLSKSASSLPASIPSTKILSSASQFSFFSNLDTTGSSEAGLGRVQQFIAAHQTDLFRQNAYLFIVLVSNGRDTEVEYVNNGSTDTFQYTSVFNSRKNALLNLKNYLHNQQFRMFSITTNNRLCSGYLPSPKSYGAMSQALYDAHVGFGYRANADHYELCGNSISNVFAEVNDSIQQIIIPHKYKYWPITFTEAATGVNTSQIKVYKSSPTQAPTLLPSSAWSYVSNTSLATYNTRVEPLPEGEPTNARHIIQFTNGNEIVYPDCVQVTSTSNLEYFGFVVLPKIPKLSTVVLKINGVTIPQSSTSGWSYIGQQTRNIKVSYAGFSDTPVSISTGYMLQLNGGSNYYKSGDSVEIYYIPETI